jgi:hypothetical protein
MNMNNPEHVFIEDIIYCPSQIYYYFSVPNGKSEDQDDRQYVAYVRQRGGPLTFELVEIREDGEWMWDWEGGTNKVKLSRVYDINGQQNVESEEQEIEALESEIMWYLRQQFPEVTFPTQPERRKREFD